MKRMNAGVFPACAVTLATKRPLAEEEILSIFDAKYVTVYLYTDKCMVYCRSLT
jgi:hypothetical protein